MPGCWPLQPLSFPVLVEALEFPLKEEFLILQLWATAREQSRNAPQRAWGAGMRRMCRRHRPLTRNRS